MIDIQTQVLQKAQFYVQVTYCETDFCHRFVNFEVHLEFVKQFEALLEEYVQQVYSTEKGVLYHKIQEVPEEFNVNKSNKPKSLKKSQVKDEYSDLDESFSPRDGGFNGYTLCIICNPVACGYDQINMDLKSSGSKQKPKKIIVNSQAFGGSENQPPSMKHTPLIGKIMFIKDSDINQSPLEENMSRWMVLFHRKLAKYCIKKPRYSELRPFKYVPNC